MDGIAFKNDWMGIFKKYRYVFLIFLVGLFLMLLPTTDTKKAPEPAVQSPEESPSLQSQLSTLLSRIDGAGNVEVLLTEASGPQTYYQSDDTLSTSENSKDQRKDTVIITNSGRGEAGLVRRIDPPVYQGAVILCQGADNANIRLSIVEAVSNATGLTTDKIAVLKMK